MSSSNFPLLPSSSSASTTKLFFFWILIAIMLPAARSGVDLRLRTYPNGFLYEEVFAITGHEFSIITSTAGAVAAIVLLYLLYNNYIYAKFLSDSSKASRKSINSNTSEARSKSIAHPQLDANTQNRIISALKHNRFHKSNPPQRS